MDATGRQDPKVLIIGEVTVPHGVRGEVRVLPLTDRPERFAKLASVLVVEGGVRGLPREAAVEYASCRGNMVFLKLAGVDDADGAAKWRGVKLGVPREEAIRLPEGHYFHFEIIGLLVVTEEGRVLGRVARIYETGANDVYEVRPEPASGRGPAGGSGPRKPFLLPALKSVIREVDVPGGKMVVRLIPGLVEETGSDAD